MPNDNFMKTLPDGRKLVAIDLSDPFEMIDQIRQAEPTLEMLSELLDSLGTLHQNLHILATAIVRMREKAEAKAKASAAPTTTSPTVNDHLRNISEADLAKITPLSEGN